MDNEHINLCKFLRSVAKNKLSVIESMLKETRAGRGSGPNTIQFLASLTIQEAMLQAEIKSFDDLLGA